MEKREQAVEVVRVEKGTAGFVKVELNTGHVFDCRPEKAPRVGDWLLMTLDADDSLDVVAAPSTPLGERILEAARDRGIARAHV